MDSIQYEKLGDCAVYEGFGSHAYYKYDKTGMAEVLRFVKVVEMVELEDYDKYTNLDINPEYMADCDLGDFKIWDIFAGNPVVDIRELNEVTNESTNVGCTKCVAVERLGSAYGIIVENNECMNKLKDKVVDVTVCSESKTNKVLCFCVIASK